MDISNQVKQSQRKFEQVVEQFIDNLKALRTGRASASMLDDIKVEAYGSTMPLKQVGSVVVAEAQLIQITPFDINNLAAISNSIRNNSNLGLNPTDDGRVVRINIPTLTEERRHELVKQIGQKHEECMINIRNVRHDTLGIIDNAKKNKVFGDDEAKRLHNIVEDYMNDAKDSSEKIAKQKEIELLSV